MAVVAIVVLILSGATLLLSSNWTQSAATTVTVPGADRDTIGAVDAPIELPAPDSLVAIPSQEAPPVAENARHLATGQASFYGPGFAGRPTANGETFNPREMTAAHKTLSFGTRLRVTNVRNGKSVIVRVNDRGPYAGNRILDLSQGAAEKIGMIASGTAQVKLEVLS